MTVTLLPDRTAAARARRYRARKRNAAVTARPVAKRRNVAVTAVTVAALIAALSLATCSAAFSISGLTAIFAGATWSVIGLGVAFEIGKLAGVAWLGQHGGGRILRAALIALVGVLMVLNTVGVYGFLAKGHITNALAAELVVDDHAAKVDADLGVQASIVADLDKRIAMLDGAIAATTRSGRTVTAMTLIGEQAHARAEIVRQRLTAIEKLSAFKVQRAGVDRERRQVEAAVGPVKYLAALLGADVDVVMRGFIGGVSVLLDPAAVLLLLAATSRPRS
jgi:hypothetical protein